MMLGNPIMNSGLYKIIFIDSIDRVSREGGQTVRISGGYVATDVQEHVRADRVDRVDRALAIGSTCDWISPVAAAFTRGREVMITDVDSDYVGSVLNCLSRYRARIRWPQRIGNELIFKTKDKPFVMRVLRQNGLL